MSKHLKKPIKSRKSSSSQKIWTKRNNQGKIDDQVYLVKIGKIQRFYIENRKVLAETASHTYNIDLRLYQVLELLPSNFIQISPIRNHQYQLHLSSQANPKRSGRNLSKKRKFHLFFTPLSKNHQGEIRTMKNKSSTTQLLVSSSASSSLSSFHLCIPQIPTHLAKSLLYHRPK